MAQYKYERREKKRRKQIEHTQKHKVGIPNLSKKDVIIVTGYIKNETKDEFTLKLSGKNLVGGLDEFKKIKEQCKEELKADVVILEVVSG